MDAILVTQLQYAVHLLLELQVDVILVTIQASEILALDNPLTAQNANENMPNMIPIGYLNENSMDCN